METSASSSCSCSCSRRRLCLKLKHNSFAVGIAALCFFLVVGVSSSVQSTIKSPFLLGVHPLDEKYFDAEVIKCKDGSKSFTRDRLNDDFCDCLDGTDEPGTSACPAGKFYCRNVGSMPQFIFSSRVNDHICDCCDGSDEYDGGIICPNTCIMGGNVEYKSVDYISTTSHLQSDAVNQRKMGINLEDLIQTLSGLKMITVAELGLGCFLVVKLISYKRVKSKKRHHR